MRYEDLPSHGIAHDEWANCFHSGFPEPEYHYPTSIDVEQVGPPSTPLDRQVTPADIAGIKHFYGEGTGGVGAELTLIAVGTFTTGEWFALHAWTDYTGWG